MRAKGFSLIELLVVMAIIAILAVIAVPMYNKYRANAMYSVLEDNLKRAVAWAEAVAVDYDKFPTGTCDASTVGGTGSLSCSIGDENSVNVVNSASGVKDLVIDYPITINFTRDSSTPTCGTVSALCDSDKCSGLTSNDGTSGPELCMITCENPTRLREDTNLHGVVNGGCP